MKLLSGLLMIALPLAAGLACDGRSARTARPDAGSDAAPSPLGAGCSACTRSKLGAPAWEPSEAALFAAGADGGGAGFVPLLSSILGPRHQYYPSIGQFGPAVAHSGPYTGELATMLAARAIAPRQRFAASDLKYPAGLALIVAIVPSASAPHGSSFDFADGPIIPNTRFPITTTGRIFRDETIFDNDVRLETLGYDRFMPPIDADGASHLFLDLFEDDVANRPADPTSGPGPPPTVPVNDGDYHFKLAITDSGGDGWVVDVPFTVGTTAGGADRDGGGLPPCVGTQPARALITDFSDATAATASQTGLNFGDAPNITGVTFSYAAPGLRAPVVTLVSPPEPDPDAGAGAVDAGSGRYALGVAVDPGPGADPVNNGWFGFGLAFDSCIDASAYHGVAFTLASSAGDLTKCDLRFAVSFSEDDLRNANSPIASCTAALCTPPASAPITTSGRFTFAFDELIFAGSPVATVNPRTITGLQWHMNLPSAGGCAATFSISDISFVAGSSRPACPIPLTSPVVVGEQSMAQPPIFTFHAPNLAPPTVSAVLSIASPFTLNALEVTADPGATTDPLAADVGVGLNVCGDVSAYTAVRFTATGDLGTCALALSAVPIIDLPPQRIAGACVNPPCASPRSPPLALGTQVVPFSEMTGGAPRATVDPTALGALEWILTAPTDGVTAPCHARLRIADVSFVAN